MAELQGSHVFDRLVTADLKSGQVVWPCKQTDWIGGASKVPRAIQLRVPSVECRGSQGANVGKADCSGELETLPRADGTIWIEQRGIKC